MFGRSPSLVLRPFVRAGVGVGDDHPSTQRTWGPGATSTEVPAHQEDTQSCSQELPFGPINSDQGVVLHPLCCCGLLTISVENV